MSILLKSEIISEYLKDRITIKPFDLDHVGPNSYDVRLSDKLVVYDFAEEKHLDVRKEHPTKEFFIPEKGFLLSPGEFYLGSTVEAIGSDYYIPMYEGRSSMARYGITSHQSAGFGDVGFKSQWTLEISVKKPIMVYPNMRIGQVYFNIINQEANLPENRYHGKYKDQSGPQKSMSFQDFVIIE